MGDDPIDVGNGQVIPPYVTSNEPVYEIEGTPDIGSDIGRDPGSGYDYNRYDTGGELPRKKKKYGEPPRRRNGCARWSLILMFGCMTMCCLCCIVPLCITATAAGGLAAVAGNSEVTAHDVQTLTVDPDQPVNLTVDNPVGSVVIAQGSGDTVEISTTKRAFGWNTERAQRELDNIAIMVTQPDTNDIQIEVDTTRDNDTAWSKANNVEMVIRVPDAVTLTIDSNLGSIIVRDVRVEAMDLNASLGSIIFEGDITDDPAASYSIVTGTGAVIIRLPVDIYARIDARADVGDVTVSNLFETMSNVNDRTDSGDLFWTGTLGSGDDDPPTLLLRSDIGAITVEMR